MSDQPFHRNSSSPRWIGGAILILIGVIFLLQNLPGFNFENWWALFILIPALTSFGRAYQAYQQEGRLSSSVRGPILGGIFFTILSFVLLFSLDFVGLWPVLLILGGVLLLINAALPG